MLAIPTPRLGDLLFWSPLGDYVCSANSRDNHIAVALRSIPRLRLPSKASDPGDLPWPLPRAGRGDGLTVFRATGPGLVYHWPSILYTIVRSL